MKTSVALSALVGGLMLSSQAMAAITVDSVTGVWTDVDPDAPAVTGEGTNVISWGTPATSLGQSGYTFVGNAPPPFPVSVGTGFNLGDFTHRNNPIFGSSLDTAELTVTTNLTIDGTSQGIESVFEFEHLETNNNSTTCADGGANGIGVNVNGCADRVTFSINVGSSESFMIGGTEFFVDITGFETGSGLATEFWTVEEADNLATLRGVITSRPGEIPVPATFALLGLGIASLGVGMAGRRKA